MIDKDDPFYHLNRIIMDIDDFDELLAKILTLKRMAKGNYAIEGGLSSIEKQLNKAHVYSEEDE